MSDSSLHFFLGQLDTAALAAFTPAPPTPASGPDPLYLIRNTDDGALYYWDGAAWDTFTFSASAAGADKQVQYNSGGAFAGVALNATATNKFLRQVSSGTPAFAQVAEADLSVTDVTTNNVTSAAHGLAPKSPADASYFLNGAATPAYAQVTGANLSMSDVTTNDVSSTKHGFAPKSVGDATKFLNSAATPAYAQVKDSDLSLSDITTNDVSITKHGFVPKAPNDATKFLDGTGAFSTVNSTPSALKVVLAERFI